VVPITDAAPFMLAVQRGYFARAGLRVTYLTTAAWADAHPATARAFAHAVEQGQALAASDRGAVEHILPSYMRISKDIAALVNLNTYPTTANPVQLQRVANLMAEGGMLHAPLNVAPLVFR
jgi:NitT/TauT family transport system substrate-binding protein